MRHASLARGVKKQFPARGNCDRLSTGIRVERSMVDTYRTSKVLADHVVIVTGYLSEKIGPEAAIVCVMSISKSCFRTPSKAAIRQIWLWYLGQMAAKHNFPQAKKWFAGYLLAYPASRAGALAAVCIPPHDRRLNRSSVLVPSWTALLPKLGPSQMAAFFRWHDAQ